MDWYVYVGREELVETSGQFNFMHPQTLSRLILRTAMTLLTVELTGSSGRPPISNRPLGPID
jgi:hypothetical protein